MEYKRINGYVSIRFPAKRRKVKCFNLQFTGDDEPVCMVRRATEQESLKFHLKKQLSRPCKPLGAARLYQS